MRVSATCSWHQVVALHEAGAPISTRSRIACGARLRPQCHAPLLTVPVHRCPEPAQQSSCTAPRRSLPPQRNQRQRASGNEHGEGPLRLGELRSVHIRVRRAGTVRVPAATVRPRLNGQLRWPRCAVARHSPPRGARRAVASTNCNHTISDRSRSAVPAQFAVLLHCASSCRSAAATHRLRVGCLQPGSACSTAPACRSLRHSRASLGDRCAKRVLQRRDS